MGADLETISMTWQQRRGACPHPAIIFKPPQQLDKSGVEEDKLGGKEGCKLDEKEQEM